jgi:hypothetical protein
MEQGRRHEALALLRPVLDRVTEGHSTPDVQEAVALHDALAGPVAQAPRLVVVQRRQVAVDA